MNLLIITKPSRYKEWQALFGLKGPHLSREGLTISSVQQGSVYWEGRAFDVVLVEEGIVLDKQQESCLCAVHRSVAFAMLPAEAFAIQRRIAHDKLWEAT